MSDPRIGQYVVRVWASGDATLPHLVESVIDDEPVTRCGRRLRAPRDEDSKFIYGSSIDGVCKRCGS